MELSNDVKRKLTQKLLFSRTRVLAKYGFLGLLLMHLQIKLDTELETAATDAKYLYFNPTFLSELSDNELDFIMMHEILHVVLKHCFRGEKYDNQLFNIACDIVINSIILYEHQFNLKSITLEKYGTSMHLTPKGDEGYQYTAEEVYEMLIKEFSNQTKKGPNGSQSNSNSNSKSNSSSNEGNEDGVGDGYGDTIDDHSKWQKANGEKKETEAQWDQRIYDAVKAVSKQMENESYGNAPSYFERLVTKITNPQIDWRYVLNEFIQEEVNDYTFMPPDSRYSEFDFYLPSYSEKDDTVKNILFMIDTSGSINNEMINYAFSEVYGAMQMFDGKLSGKLGFFDYVVHDVTAFEDATDLSKIRPKGGGGTSFYAVFEYVDRMEELPCMLIILTDGYAPFPDLDNTYPVPVLWLINNDKVTPPFGKIARIKIEKN